MKAILISIQSPHACNILNLIKLLEIRKKFPKDYVGWVYIYVTKGNKHECLEYADNPNPNKEGKWVITSGYPYANGKVVARFWCDKVEEIETDYAPRDTFFKECCLTPMELFDYIGHSKWYAIHITKLEIFDKPKEISEFWGIGKKCKYDNMIDREWYCEYCKKPDCIKPLTRAPQSWCYVEV